MERKTESKMETKSLNDKQNAIILTDFLLLDRLKLSSFSISLKDKKQNIIKHDTCNYFNIRTYTFWNKKVSYLSKISSCFCSVIFSNKIF